MELKESPILGNYAISNMNSTKTAPFVVSPLLSKLVHPLVLRIKQELKTISPGYLVKDFQQPHSGYISDLKPLARPSPEIRDYTKCFMEKEVILMIGGNSLLARRKASLQKQ